MESPSSLANRSVHGFTIVELLIVIVVIGVLAAIVIVAYNGITVRAQYTTMHQDLSSVRKAIELYHTEHGEYPDSADCVSSGGQTNYQNGWCGWDQGQGDSFVPGLVPKYLERLPTLDASLPQFDSYLYQSRGPNGIHNGTTEYQLIRYRSTGLGGLSSIERDTSTNPDVLVGGDGGYTGEEAWGYRSKATQPWW